MSSMAVHVFCWAIIKDARINNANTTGAYNMTPVLMGSQTGPRDGDKYCGNRIPCFITNVEFPKHNNYYLEVIT